MKHVITLRILVDTKNDRDEQMLEKAASFLVEQAEKQLRNFHYEVLGSEAGNSKPTKEESMRLVPRKVHYGMMNCPLCADKLVPESRLTEKWHLVTCKPCLKKRPETAQKELFT